MAAMKNKQLFLEAVSLLIGIRIAGAAIQDDDAEDAEDCLYAAAELAPMTNAALKEICKSFHIAQGGNTNELIQKIPLHMKGPMIKSNWLMTPTSRSHYI